jgi:hypothetical protein
MNTKYDARFNMDEQLRLHQTFLPFVGDMYDQYKVLHIGESHYIGQTPDNEKYSISYFEKWWESSCEDVINDYPGWADTRMVMSNYMQGKYGAYTIFTNFIKSFSRVVLKKEISNISHEDKSLYEYVAFMNFFQMPSIYEGMKFWDSLELAAEMAGDTSLALKMWNKAVEKSINTVDAVIEIIEPKAIVFTTVSAGNAYKEANGKYSKDSRVIYTSHPGYPYTWWKSLKSLDGKRGIDVMEEGLRNIFTV